MILGKTFMPLKTLIMKLIKSKVTNLTPTSYNYNDIIKHIELCGRTCYKSEDKRTDSSAEKFVNMLKSNHHMSVLEHGTVYLDIPMNDNFSVIHNPYSVVNFYLDEDGFERIAMTTNYRVILENNLDEEFKLYSISIPTKYHEQRYTFRITCSRAIANEVVRHRQMSYSQESTRYCNYSKDKFGGELTFIKPEWLSENAFEVGNKSGDVSYLDKAESSYLNFLIDSEVSYLDLIKENIKPENARGVLPLDLKTDLIVTGTKSQWDAFFKLRCAKSAHPDIQIIANKIKGMIYGEY